MAYLYDSNILLRLIHRHHPDHALVRGAVRKLHQRGEQSYYTTQNLAEFWNVNTRPTTARGGLGLSVVDTGWRQGVHWKNFEVDSLPSGKPILRISGRAAELAAQMGVTNINVTLTHDVGVAAAVVIFEGE